MFRNITTLLIGLFFCANLNAQSCGDIINYLQSNESGATYSSYNSSSISSVTFYEVSQGYNTSYYAIVVFKRTYGEYVYQVGSNTESNYSSSYRQSAGKAFWDYIQPYNEVLGCAR